jgi:carboxypeptidase family protein
MNALPLLRRHSLLRVSRLTIVGIPSQLNCILAFAGLVVGVCALPALDLSCLPAPAFAARSQEPQPSAAPPAGQTQTPQKNKKKKKHSHEYDFLLIGTVFTEKGFSLEGAELRVRRMTEVKFRWEARSDRRGEFALRVPQGADYEIVVLAKGFQVQTRTVDAKSGDREDLVFRLVPASQGKSK